MKPRSTRLRTPYEQVSGERNLPQQVPALDRQKCTPASPGSPVTPASSATHSTQWRDGMRPMGLNRIIGVAAVALSFTACGASTDDADVPVSMATVDASAVSSGIEQTLVDGATTPLEVQVARGKELARLGDSKKSAVAAIVSDIDGEIHRVHFVFVRDTYGGGEHYPLDEQTGELYQFMTVEEDPEALAVAQSLDLG